MKLNKRREKISTETNKKLNENEMNEMITSILLEYLWWDKKTWTDFYLAKLSKNRILNNFKVVGYLAKIFVGILPQTNRTDNEKNEEITILERT